jgi:hypothetical protein
MVKDLNSDRRSPLELKIAAAMEELRQLHLKPTLDDFQNFWRKKLEASLLGLREEMRGLEAEDRNTESGSATAMA